MSEKSFQRYSYMDFQGDARIISDLSELNDKPDEAYVSDFLRDDDEVKTGIRRRPVLENNGVKRGGHIEDPVVLGIFIDGYLKPFVKDLLSYRKIVYNVLTDDDYLAIYKLMMNSSIGKKTNDPYAVIEGFKFGWYREQLVSVLSILLYNRDIPDEVKVVIGDLLSVRKAGKSSEVRLISGVREKLDSVNIKYR